uniref:Hemopexin n=1 Tax=Candidatus Kentrum sp. UNK TaxID=2126344 RepID=A0A451AY25_9GAMM|nr:MAG: Hemopexin [Candidatus Kentron sp. UNK]VFK70948.1 MAG: Hemopexin [Candidatus Kentron sp. UNK]
MSMKTSLPNYAGLFGNIDFKKGDEARSVYSPAAYLTDLLQMLDDEFDAKTIDFHQRRGDIKSIDLDEENTNTLIPYLDVANEVLEGRTGKGADALYDETLPAAKYPFNMPFSFNNEKRKNHLGHLGISARELRHLFATETDYATVAREYLGLSTEELAAFVEPTESVADADLEAAYGYTGESFVSDMSNVSTFMEQTDLEAEEVRELIYQKLYIEPSDHSVVEDGREHFYINKGLSGNVESTYYSGYVTLNTAETEFEWKSLSDTDSTTTTLPPQWFDRASRFIRFAQKTGLAFTELDHILRHCCEVNGIPTLDNDTLLSIAQVAYLHKTFEQPIDAIVAVLSTISYTGRANEDYPADQFNRVFNSPCVKVDEKYFHIDGSTGEIPEQYADTTYHDYERIPYHGDLFSDDNDDYRERLRHTLGFTETDLINITERLEYEEVATSALWEETANEWDLLNILYRIHALSSALDVHFLDLFTMLDLLEQDPFIGRMDPHTYFIYRTPSTQKCFEILVGNSVGDRLWLFESLAAINKWMKQFGYSAEMLWNIVNAAPLTDKAQALRKKQDLALYNALIEGFKGRELTPETFQEALGDERAARFAYALFQGPFGHRQENRDYPHGCGERGKPWQESMRQLAKHTPRAHDELAEEFIGQLSHITEEEFIGLSLEDKLQEKLLANLVIHEVIDGDGNILAKSIVDVDDDGDANDDGYVADPPSFRLEYDFSGIRHKVFDLFHEIYEKDSEGTDDPDDIEVQIFKSDLKALGLEEPEARELYDTLIHNGIIDDQGYARDVHRFGDPDGADSLELGAGLWAVEQDVQDHLNTQVAKFEASRIVLGEQRFEALGLKPVERQDLMTNLRMNRYLDEDNVLIDKLRILDETPDTMELAWEFYPHRAAIFQVLHDAIAEDKETHLKMDQDTLGEIAARVVSHWVYQDLQGAYLRGHRLQSEAGAFFLAEENRADFTLRGYFDTAKSEVVFDHIAGIVKYADSYRLTDEALTALDFDEQEINGLKAALREADVLNDDDTLRADRAPFFLAPKNVNDFTVPGFEDYDKEVFFQLHGVAKAIDGVVRSIDEAMRQQNQLQETAILEQLQGVLGIDPAAVKMLSKAIFKTEDNLHFAWLMPLLESANALNRLDELPANMQYTQAVKRIRQLALLIKKLQLSTDELAIALEDQNLVAKFPEDIILPDRVVTVDGVTSVETITSVDAILEAGEFVYFFKDDYYWIFLVSDYTLIDRKEVVAGRTDDDDDLIDLQKEDEARQKRLKEDPIRRLFDEEDIEKVDAAFIDQYGAWCIVSGNYHYVKYEGTDVWDRRDNNFGQVDNAFENVEMIDAAYVDQEGRLFLFCNEQYARYSEVDFTLGTENATQPTMDAGYPKSIAEDWNDENQPIQLPEGFYRDLGPMFDGLDDHSYAFLGNVFVSSEDGRARRCRKVGAQRV